MKYIERYWRDANPEDAIKEPPMVARFRDREIDAWIIDQLCGVDTSKKYWFSEEETLSQIFWWQCQVYDAPDPGEGYELLDVFKDKPQEGDEYREAFQKEWSKRDDETASFCPLTYYRRRIAPPEPKYMPFTWEDRKELQGRMVQLHWENGTKQEMLLHHFTLSTDGQFEIAKVCAEKMLKIGVFLDTGKPVGKLIS